MTDKQKIYVLQSILRDYWDNGGDVDGQAGCLLSVIYVIVNLEAEADG